jgi:hypothetical protein
MIDRKEKVYHKQEEVDKPEDVYKAVSNRIDAILIPLCKGSPL